LVTLPPVAFIAVNTMVRHELGQSAYRQRVAECALAVEAIRQRDPLVESLRDARVEHLALISDPVIRRRAWHVITENQRVLDFVAASRQCDLAMMGRLMAESHLSLRGDYEVSCAELDFLVETARSVRGVWGARMTGGGFGGCTVNLVEPQASDEFENAVGAAYRERFGVNAEIYVLDAAAGAARIS
jgi:galactokinase